jgi:hypothetical protein
MDYVPFYMQWRTLEARREHRCLVYVWRCVNKQAPPDLTYLFLTKREDWCQEAGVPVVVINAIFILSILILEGNPSTIWM